MVVKGKLEIVIIHLAFPKSIHPSFPNLGIIFLTKQSAKIPHTTQENA
jgi:hypothetical protein